jgi:hypothetical protein
MKMIGLMVMSLVFVGVSSPALAKAPKATILHCGCNEAGDGMQYWEIEVSRNSGGHRNHVVGSVDSCFDGVDTFTDFVRTGDDCKVSGSGVNYLNSCEEETEGDDCGAPTAD